MAQTLYATNNFTGNGITTAWTISWQGGYLSTADVKARYFDTFGEAVDIPVTSVVGSVVTITPAVADGREFQIYRDTQKGIPLVDYSDGAILNEENLDTTTRQAVFTAAEAWDLSFDTRGVAQEARETAAAALVTAQTALSTANDALAASAAASTSAAAAQNSASIAQNAATAAANNAATASSTANNALQVANGIDAKATTALNNSTTAITTANNALSGVSAKLGRGGDSFTGDTGMPSGSGFTTGSSGKLAASAWGWVLNLDATKLIRLGGTNSNGLDGLAMGNNNLSVLSNMYKPMAAGNPLFITNHTAATSGTTALASNTAGMRLATYSTGSTNAFQFDVNSSGAGRSPLSITYDGDVTIGSPGRTLNLLGNYSFGTTVTYDRIGIRSNNSADLTGTVNVLSLAGATLTASKTSEYFRTRLGFFCFEQFYIKFTADVTGGTGAGDVGIYGGSTWAGSGAPSGRASNANARFPVQYCTINGVVTEVYAKFIPGTTTFQVPRWQFFRKATDVSIKDNEFKNNDELIFIVTYPLSTIA